MHTTAELHTYNTYPNTMAELHTYNTCIHTYNSERLPAPGRGLTGRPTRTRRPCRRTRRRRFRAGGPGNARDGHASCRLSSRRDPCGRASGGSGSAADAPARAAARSPRDSEVSAVGREGSRDPWGGPGGWRGGWVCGSAGPGQDPMPPTPGAGLSPADERDLPRLHQSRLVSVTCHGLGRIRESARAGQGRAGCRRRPEAWAEECQQSRPQPDAAGDSLPPSLPLSLSLSPSHSPSISETGESV